MTDDDTADGVPEGDPRHLDPAGDIAELVESGGFDIDRADDQNPEELREFIRRAEAGEFGDDPGVEATVRIARSLLEATEGEDE